MSFGLWSMKKITGARFLHDIWPGEPGHLTEPIIAVDDSTVLHSSISNDEFLSAIKESYAFFSTLSTFHKVLIARMYAKQPLFSLGCLKCSDFQSFCLFNLIQKF